MTTQNWSNNDKSRYNMLYSYLKQKVKNLNEDTFIQDKKNTILNQIENNNNWAETTKEALYFMIAKHFKIVGDPTYAKLYSEKGYKYMLKNREKESENKQDEKEKENYRSHDYLLNILDNIKTITTKKEHLQYLLLNMLVFAPPLRTSFYLSCKFIFNESENDLNHNFILINGGTIKYIVNQDKVSNSSIYLNHMNSIINVESEKVIKLIIASYKKYPRNYLLEIDGKPITHATYLEWLRKITGVKLINNDIMRSSYINWYYQHNPSLKAREKLALQMRHSVPTSQRNYIKIIDPVNDLDYEILNSTTENKLNDAVYKKKRRDILYKINNKGVIPKDQTLEKYSIIYDEINKKYH